MDKMVDLGPVQEFIDDPSVSEIMINRPNQIFVEKDGKKILTKACFRSEEEVFNFINKVYGDMGKRVDKDVPCADVCLEDGTRINVIIPPLARFGTAITFRKLSKKIKGLEDLIAAGTLTKNAADLLIACVRGKVNMVFSGGTGVGKTTLLQVLSSYFAPDERVVVIEDAAELKLTQENCVSLETRTPDKDGRGEISIRDLIRNSLRMTPDRLVIGEVRGGEAIDMLQAMATGHAGTIGIVHGNSPKDVLARLEAMVLMSGIQLPLWEIRKLVVSTVNVVVHLARMQDGSRKITHITETRGIDKEEIALNDLFAFNFEKLDEHGKVLGILKPSMRYYPLFFHEFQKRGLITDSVFGKD